MLALALGRATTMARAPAGLPAGIRLTDHISLGVIARTFPIEQVRRVLAETGRASERERDLPAHVMVYYAIALALYTGAGTREVLRCLLEGLRWLWGADVVRVAGKPNKIIAYELSIAETTVKAHVTLILRKLGVFSRTQAVLAARDFVS